LSVWLLNSRSIWLGEDEEVAVEVADPDFAVTGVRVEMYVGDDMRVRVADPGYDGVEAVDLER
jgi:hypothetical protein